MPITMTAQPGTSPRSAFNALGWAKKSSCVFINADYSDGATISVRIVHTPHPTRRRGKNCDSQWTREGVKVCRRLEALETPWPKTHSRRSIARPTTPARSMDSGAAPRGVQQITTTSSREMSPIQNSHEAGAASSATALVRPNQTSSGNHETSPLG